MSDERAVGATYRWQNGMAMVFDEDGEQIPELQGPVTPELASQIRKRSTPGTKWVGWGEEGPAIWPRRVDSENGRRCG